MAKRKTAAEWRAFLRALARTGNVRVAAREAGMDVGTAYDRRIKDDAFAASFGAAVAKAKALAAPRLRSGRAGGKRAGEELVVRKSKRHGVQLVRVGAGRWNPKAEAAFFAGLARTACVRRAAAACGFSTTALYNRREAYPEFAERWDAVEAAALVRIPALLAAATIASLDPEIEGDDLPKVNVDQAIAIARLKGAGGVHGPAARGRGIRPRIATNAEVREALTKRLAAFHKRVRAQRVAEGWTETAEGSLIPPGWVFVGTSGAGGDAPG